MASTNGCSGDNTQYVAPNKVSQRVVNTVNSLSCPSTLKTTLAPTDLPIQFFCISIVEDGQSNNFKSSNKRSAYSVIFNTHWRIGLRTTGYPPRSLFPSITSSLAKTAFNSGHQLTGTSST